MWCENTPKQRTALFHLFTSLFKSKRHKVLFACPFKYTVEPVLGGTVFSGHPLLSGHVVKSRKFNINTIKVNFIERSPLLSGRGHLSHGPKINCSSF